jgi:hypothetical protein
VVLAPNAAGKLSDVLPNLSSVISQLPRQPLTAARLIRRWDVDVARWLSVSDASVPGAYQLVGSTTVYCLRDHGDVMRGTMRRADPRFVKHAASLEAERHLLGYDSSTQMLYFPLGAELPGLYHRAAVLASGLLPVEDEVHRVVAYRDVPIRLAEKLSASLRS